MLFFNTKAGKQAKANSDLSESEYIPYKCHWNRNTILTKDNKLIQVLKVDGFSFETADDEDLDIRKTLRNSLFKSMTSGNLNLYFHTIRKKRPIITTDKFTIDPTIRRENNFVQYLDHQWKQKYADALTFFNEMYVTIVYQPETGGVATLEYLYKKIRGSSTQGYWESDMKEMHENLEEVSARVFNTLRDYNPSQLGVYKTDDGYYCEILEFLSSLVNGGCSTKSLMPRGDLSKHLPESRIVFKPRYLEVINPKFTKYGAIVSIREYSPHTSAGIFDVFLQVPFEFIMTQSFSFANRTIAIKRMQLQQNRMIQAQDKAVSQIADISRALDMAMSGDIGFGEHHFSLLCFDDNSPKSLENTVSSAGVELSNCGMQPVREIVNMEPTFWGQLPGNGDYLVRKSTINTLNLSGFAAMHNYPVGKIENNHWGEYVTVLNTTSGTSYYFNFHVRDVGHTLIIGPTGAGKTVLMNFLCAQAQKFKPRMYFFDKDRGAEIFIRAIGGIYTAIDPSSYCGFNPLKMPDNGPNRTFLLDWLRLLVTVNDEQLTSEDIKLLSSAIEGNYKLNHQDRKLSNIVPFLGIATGDNLASRIEMWHGYGSHAKIFDNDEDTIDLEKARSFGFEMGDLLKDSISLGPVLSYIFHRINISLDGYPTMLVLDEAWALIDNPIFAPKIKDWLKVLRKLNAFVIFATQSVEDAAKSRISDTLIQQTATQIFLPNLKATTVYRTSFMLSEREYEIIKTTEPSSRYFLVKQGINAVVARIDLSGMDNVINVLSGRSDTVLLLKKLIEEYGENPEKWLPTFYSEVKKL
jgi:type IV secretion system protein VirB4